jgi:hypothetical protein
VVIIFTAGYFKPRIIKNYFSIVLKILGFLIGQKAQDCFAITVSSAEIGVNQGLG